jgi:acylphosphatase
MKIAKKYIIKGQVQGVGFRYFTTHLANRIGIYGYVKNLWDGSVEVYAIGTEQQIKTLKAGLSKGPSYSYVQQIIEEEMQVDPDYNAFNIRF